ncbi:MAG: HEAT repeat domain-containing protein [Myxococcales bacterium]|nr:HEAT repeat domain-containing protein [Myxococcales bacterium]
MKARAVGFGLAFALCACASEPPTASQAPAAAQVTRLRVHDGTPLELRPAPLDERRLRADLAAALIESGLPVGAEAPDVWRLASGLERAWRRAGIDLDALRIGWEVEIEAELVYGIAVPDGLAPKATEGTAKAVWSIELRLRPPKSDEKLYADVEAADEAPFAGDAAALGPALEARAAAATRRAAANIMVRVNALRQPVAALIDGLAASDPEVRRASAGRLAMLRSAEAVPAMIGRLATEADRDVLLRLIGALAEIGDDRAVEPLIELADPRDREVLRAVIDALAAMGGQRAGDFFDLLSAHDDADIRLMVEQARARMRRPQVPQ